MDPRRRSGGNLEPMNAGRRMPGMGTRLRWGDHHLPAKNARVPTPGDGRGDAVLGERRLQRLSYVLAANPCRGSVTAGRASYSPLGVATSTAHHPAGLVTYRTSPADCSPLLQQENESRPSPRRPFVPRRRKQPRHHERKAGHRNPRHRTRRAPSPPTHCRRGCGRGMSAGGDREATVCCRASVDSSATT